MSEQFTPLNDDDVHADPHVQFEKWFTEGRPQMAEPDAVVLATVDANNRPRSRWVLMRIRGPEGYGFFTNYDSDKGRELAANPVAALVWRCEPLGRQVRIEGPCERADAWVSDEYFASRPREHQLNAWASAQSRPTTVDTLGAELAAVRARFGDGTVPRPPHWGGFVVRPTRIEFFQHRANRFHDRVVYEPTPGGWRRWRAAP